MHCRIKCKCSLLQNLNPIQQVWCNIAPKDLFKRMMKMLRLAISLWVTARREGQFTLKQSP